MPNILVVDDDVSTAKALTSLLRHSGYASAYVLSGEEALARLKGEVPDLMILDVMMPGMDGMEVLRQVREDPRTARLPVVVFSALSDPTYVQHAKEKGASDYWVKAQFDFAKLPVHVRRLVGDDGKAGGGGGNAGGGGGGGGAMPLLN